MTDPVRAGLTWLGLFGGRWDAVTSHGEPNFVALTSSD